MYLDSDLYNELNSGIKKEPKRVLNTEAINANTEAIKKLANFFDNFIETVDYESCGTNSQINISTLKNTKY